MSEIEIKELTGTCKNLDALQRVLESSQGFYYRIYGMPPDQHESGKLFKELPGDVRRDFKFVYGIYLMKNMIGCIDFIRGYPGKDVTIIGLFLLSEGYQGKGYGRKAYELLETKITLWEEIHKLRLGVNVTNACVLPFWFKMGFQETVNARRFISIM